MSLPWNLTKQSYVYEHHAGAKTFLYHTASITFDSHSIEKYVHCARHGPRNIIHLQKAAIVPKINSKRSLCKTSTHCSQTKLLLHFMAKCEAEKGNQRRQLNTQSKEFYRRGNTWRQLLKSLQNYESQKPSLMASTMLTLNLEDVSNCPTLSFYPLPLPFGYHENRTSTKREYETLHCQLV